MYQREHRRQCCVCRGVGQARLGLSVHQLSSTRSSAAVSPERLRIFAQESALLRRGFCFTPAFGRRVGCARNGLGAKSKRKGERKYRNGAPSETGPEPPETGPEFGNRDLNPRNGARFSRPVSNGPFLRFSQAGGHSKSGAEAVRMRSRHFRASRQMSWRLAGSRGRSVRCMS